MPGFIDGKLCRWGYHYSNSVAYGLRLSPSGTCDRRVWIQSLSFGFWKFASTLWICSITKIERSSREWPSELKWLVTGFSRHQFLYPIDGRSFVSGAHLCFSHILFLTFYTLNHVDHVSHLVVSGGFFGYVFLVTQLLKVLTGCVNRSYNEPVGPGNSPCKIVVIFVQTEPHQ